MNVWLCSRLCVSVSVDREHSRCTSMQPECSSEQNFLSLCAGSLREVRLCECRCRQHEPSLNVTTDLCTVASGFYLLMSSPLVRQIKSLRVEVENSENCTTRKKYPVFFVCLFFLFIRFLYPPVPKLRVTGVSWSLCQ